MRAWITVADYAQVHVGKLVIVGGGVTLVGPGLTTIGVAVQIVALWDDRGHKNRLRCTLFDQDGGQVKMQTVTGQDIALEAVADFEVMPAPGSPPGIELPFAFAFNVANLPLPPGSYQWRLFIGDEDKAAAITAFHVRKAAV